MTSSPEPYGRYPPPTPDGGHPGGYYSYPAGYPTGYLPPQTTNSLAIVSLVCAFLFAPLGIVFGHMSLSQIKKTGEVGRGLAIAGLVISYLVVAFTVLVAVVSLVFLMVMARDFDSTDHHMFINSKHPGATATATASVHGSAQDGQLRPQK